MRIDEKYDVIIVGGGHAGCEAALSAAKLGARCLMLNLYLDNTAMMPCNPSIGGPAKGHIVREIDALGGEMACATDFSTQHLRWLNTSKGPAVKTLRAQCDPRKYTSYYKKALLTTPNLEIHQAQVTDILIKDDATVGVKIKTGQSFYSKTVILATGTYLGSKIYIGLTCHKSGPLGMVAATELSRSLRRTGLRMGRLRTDTTPRLLFDSIDWESLDKQESMDEPQAFSYFGENRIYSGMFCALTRTNKRTHETVRKYFSQSPIFMGKVESKGPRYCPSIDDKVIRFPTRDSHPIFLEPISPESREVYVQNFSTSMCLEAQFEAVRTIKGCENAHILRPGYAIEYDFIDPIQLEPWLEVKRIKNLFLAGQINGTSGYEEAAAQGLVAGINAALKVRGEEPLILGRDKSYIGVLIDDLVTKGTSEPYRMLTSRCEYRLILRHDNADTRLSRIGHDIGLLDDKKWRLVCERRVRMERGLEFLRNAKVTKSAKVNEILNGLCSSPIDEPIPVISLMRRPEMTWEAVAEITGFSLDKELGDRILTEVKYEGYITRQMKQIDKLRRMEKLKIPDKFNFEAVTGLSSEGSEKLKKIAPRTLGMASRIPGVPPADIQLLWVAIENRWRQNDE